MRKVIRRVPVFFFVAVVITLIFLLFYYGPIHIVQDFGDYLSTLNSEIDYRAEVSQARSDMRALATVLESYFIDHGAYPVGRPLQNFTERKERLKKIGGENLLGPEPGMGRSLHGLTTPFAYIKTIPMDKYSNAPRPRLFYMGRFFTRSHDRGIVPYSYYVEGNAWILFSAGPDLDYDIHPVSDFEYDGWEPTASLLLKSYDPTNGVASSGDIFRIKQ